jgi:transposase-like protein
MTITEINKKFNTIHKCYDYLEKLRWGKTVKCPYCNSANNKRLKEDYTRHKCNNCKRSFSVTVDTIFDDSKLPMPKWFLIIGLMLNSKSGMSAKEIQRQVGLTYKTAYYSEMRIRCGMLEKDTNLHGIIEMDESYFGGKARKIVKNLPDNTPSLATTTLKRGRGTNKISVVGMVERQGDVKTKVIEKLTKRNLLSFLKSKVKKDDSLLMTDGFKSYSEFDKYIEHMILEHKKQFSKGVVHVNTIESFWSYIKNGIRGNYRSISPKYLPFYLVQYEWHFNHRNFKGNLFEKFLKNALEQEKELEYWKAESSAKVKNIVYE